MFFMSFSMAKGQYSTFIANQISAANLVPNVGISVYDMEEQKTVLGINENSLYTPASIQKVVTAIYVINKLKKGYSSTTNVYEAQNGDLYIEFSGDPKFNFGDLEDLLKPLKGKIINNIFLAETEYQLPLLSPGWTIAATQLCYGALATKSSIGENRVVAYVTAGKIGQKAQVNLRDGQVIYPIINQTVTKKLCYSDPSVGWMDQMQRDNIDMTKDGLIIKGCVPHDFKKFKLCLPIKPDNLKDYLSKAMNQAIGKCGIKVKGSILYTEKVPQDAKLISSRKSPLLIDMVKESLKDSDNFVTDSLFKIATEVDETKIPANWVFAGKVVRQELNRFMGTTFSDKDLKIEDGSGLSLYNRISPDAMATLLSKMHWKEPSFYKMLPKAGSDGTLVDRLKSVKGRVWAKTGMLNGINTLAGYITKNGKPRYSFAIMINGPTDQPSYNKKLIDQIVKTITKSL
jgi:D-alanyl-D-alanine carboxypeptidase/D-alanyl-D-alanine-endopeptidase (penicillin-binding protein 4)